MPSGKTHEKVNLRVLFVTVFLLSVGLFYAASGVTGALACLLFFCGFLFGTYYLSPDLDIKSRPYYRWKLLRFLWVPYHKTFSHRSFWTHGFVIGDLIRVLYLVLILLIPCSLLLTAGNWDAASVPERATAFFLEHRHLLASLFLGIVFSSALHSSVDWLSILWSKNFRKAGRGSRK